MRCTTIEHEHLNASHEVFIEKADVPTWYPYCSACTETLQLGIGYKTRPLYQPTTDESLSVRVERLESELKQLRGVNAEEAYLQALSHIARVDNWLTDDPYDRIRYLQHVAWLAITKVGERDKSVD